MLKRAHKIVVFIDAVMDNVYNFLKNILSKIYFFLEKKFLLIFAIYHLINT